MEKPIEFANHAHPEPPQDITHQVTRLARAIDRLPPGSYVVELQKATRLDSWRAVIRDNDGQPVREMELVR